MADDITVAVYGRGALTASQVQKAIEDAQLALAADKDALAELGVTADDVKGLFRAKEEQSGFVAETILVSILIGAGSQLAADAAKYTARKVWSAVFEKVRQQRGSDALGDEQQSDPGVKP
jgi:hypothetical protein